MSLGAVIILVAIIVGYYYLRDMAGKRAMHKRAIAKSCLCGECAAKKEARHKQH